MEQLEHVCGREQPSVEREALRVVAVAAEGGMRDALSLLEQVIAYTGDHVDGSAAAACLGLVDRHAVMALLEACAEQDRAGALRQLDALYSAGADLRRFADALVAEVRGLVICGEVAQSDGLIDSTLSISPSFNRLAGLLDPVHGRRWLRVALDAARRSAEPATLGPCSSSPSCGWPMAPARKRSVSCFISFGGGAAPRSGSTERRGHSAPSPLTTADRRLVCVRPSSEARACAAPGAPSAAARSPEAAAKRSADGAAAGQ